MTKNKLWQAIKGLTLAAGMAVGILRWDRPMFWQIP